ncbi:MAG: tetratricopeptide repeat protein [Pseudomonadota bacterium]|nr:tetratricopeptide repeat protein [Pseudomonadota bacterium]
MKFVKPLLVAAVLLSGCAAQQQQPQEEQAVVVDTASYLPLQTYDEQGIKIPYISAENPYLLQKGTVSKGSVLLFIEARRALNAGDEKTAQQKLKVITDQDNTLAGPYVMLGDISMKHEDYKKASESYRKAISINGQNVNAYLGLGEALRRQGEFTAAQNTYEEALRVWRDFPEAHLNLGVLYDLYLNMPAKAQAHYEAYLFLTHNKTHKANQWYEEVKSRTGITKSFVDPGPPQIKEAKPAKTASAE